VTVSSFLQSLRAAGPAPEHADKLALYGQFVGDREAEAQAFMALEMRAERT
jgi:hypothetical protein